MFKNILNKIKLKYIRHRVLKRYSIIDIENLKMKDLYKISNIKLTILGNNYIEFINLIRELKDIKINNITRSKFSSRYNLIKLEDCYLRDGYVIDITSNIKLIKDILIELSIKIEEEEILKHGDSDYVIGLSVAKDIKNILEEFLTKITLS